MSPSAESTTVDIDGRRLKLSNLAKVLYPAAGFTKGEVIDYYVRVAPVLLPHLAGRPLTLKRYPDGVESEYFYEKQCPSHAPEWVSTVRIPSGRAARGHIDYCVVDGLPALVWVANLASLELHPLLARADDPRRPTLVVFDLDPGAPAGVVECAEVARWLREAFDGLGLACFAKTSGSKGLQVYVPLNTADATYDVTKTFARSVAEMLERLHPKRVTSNMSKDQRVGRVFVDWSQNDEHKTTVCVYSLRARERPTVSTPVTWDEVEAAVEAREPGLLSFDAAAVAGRVAEHGDLFAPVLDLEQRLPA